MSKEINLNKVVGPISEIACCLTTSVATSILMTDLASPAMLANLTKSTLITTPVLYLGLQLGKKKFKTYEQKISHYNAQMRMLHDIEANELNRNITKTTTRFINELVREFVLLDMENVIADEQTLTTLNQLIYLINYKYAESIMLRFPNIDREDIALRLIRHLALYIQNKNKTKFTHKDVLTALKGTLILSDEMIAAIDKDFKSAKTFSSTLEPIYAIIRDDTKPTYKEYAKTHFTEEHPLYMQFNVDDITFINALIEATADNNYWKIKYGVEAKDKVWDTDFLRTILKIITITHRDTLRKELDDYSAYVVAQDFVCNAMEYAVSNNHQVVGEEELLNTFKEWNYISFQTRLEILETIFETEHLDYKIHPLGVKTSKNKRHPQKVITFKSPITN